MLSHCQQSRTYTWLSSSMPIVLPNVTMAQNYKALLAENCPLDRKPIPPTARYPKTKTHCSEVLFLHKIHTLQHRCWRTETALREDTITGWLCDRGGLQQYKSVLHT